MRIWIDLTNSPHINFFRPFIETWEKEGCEIIITCRNLANTIDLIKQNGWQFSEIGGHAGKNIIKKTLNFPLRVLQLAIYLKKYKPDIGISHSSFYSPLAAKLLGIPSIYINDNEHAKGNYLAFKFASINLVPEFLKFKSEELGWEKKFIMKYYPGIKEAIYLSQKKMPDKVNSLNKPKRSIYIRLEPWTAQYYKKNNFFIDHLLLELIGDYNIVLLPRGREQAEHYKSLKFNGIKIIDIPLNLEEIYMDCDLFIGAGGSMTREIAFLGVPTISIYQDNLLEVDKYLINQGMMHYLPSLQKKDIEKILGTNHADVSYDLRQKGQLSFTLIKSLVYKYAKN